LRVGLPPAKLQPAASTPRGSSSRTILAGGREAMEDPMAFEPGIVVSTRVRSDRVADFERWVRDVLETSVEMVAGVPPHRWSRQWDVTGGDAEGVEYLLLGAGSDLSGFDLEPVLVEVYGVERAHAELELLAGMLIDEQDAWSLVPVPRGED
jgi:hypothetical protein